MSHPISFVSTEVDLWELGLQPGRAAMFEDESRVLLILSRDVLDRARVLAGKATTTLKLPVSLQIVLRALIEEGLNREGDRRLLANITRQAQAVRRIRSVARRNARAAARRLASLPKGRRAPSAPQRRRRKGRSGD